MAAGYESSELPLVIEQSMFAWIEVLWGNEDYDFLWELLRQALPAMEPALLQLYAKVCFKRLKNKGIMEMIFPCSGFQPSIPKNLNPHFRMLENATGCVRS